MRSSPIKTPPGLDFHTETCIEIYTYRSGGQSRLGFFLPFSEHTQEPVCFVIISEAQGHELELSHKYIISRLLLELK
jgi:hypothetical protein